MTSNAAIAEEKNSFSEEVSTVPSLPTFLLSIDLEDLRTQFEGGMKYRDPVEEMTYKYLQLLDETDNRITFFTVGDIGRRYPSLVRDIVSSGHEIACHTNTHVPLDKQCKEGFDVDLGKNIESLMKAGASEIGGFRAPFFSLTRETDWAYDILRKHGLFYSSSVLPAANPIYGWGEFGEEPRRVNGIIELPMTLNRFFPKIPIGGGVYFRAIPLPLLKLLFKAQRRPIASYFHPYDIDPDQERFVHPGIPDKVHFQFLMYYNRKGLISKLKSIIKMGFPIRRYDEFAREVSLGL